MNEEWLAAVMRRLRVIEADVRDVRATLLASEDQGRETLEELAKLRDRLAELCERLTEHERRLDKLNHAAGP